MGNINLLSHTPHQPQGRIEFCKSQLIVIHTRFPYTQTGDALGCHRDGKCCRLIVRAVYDGESEMTLVRIDVLQFMMGIGHTGA